jgi:hypothetical protein
LRRSFEKLQRDDQATDNLPLLILSVLSVNLREQK